MFIKKFFQRKFPKEIKKQKNQNLVVFQSDSLNFSIVQQRNSINTVLTIKQWETILNNNTFDGYPYGRVYFSFLKGIPQKLRMKIWMMLSGISLKDQQYSLNQYMLLVKKQKLQKDTHQIDCDIPRSFAGNEKYVFAKQSIRRMLYALSSYKITYTQGMNYIILNVLIFCIQSQKGAIKQEKQIDLEFQKNVFWIFVYIVKTLNSVFGQQLKQIFEVIKELETLIIENVPEVLFHIGKLGLDVMSLFAQNYFALMMYSSPPPSLAKSLFDLFLLQRQKAIHALLMRMILMCTDQILSMNQAEQLQKFLKCDIFKVCAERLDDEKRNALAINDFAISFYEQSYV